MHLCLAVSLLCAAPMALAAEHVLPALLLAGLVTRLSALGLIGMSMVIQLFVYPDAWWPVHSIWVALALILVARGGGLFSLDAMITGESAFEDLPRVMPVVAGDAGGTLTHRVRYPAADATPA